MRRRKETIAAAFRKLETRNYDILHVTDPRMLNPKSHQWESNQNPPKVPELTG